MSRPALFFAAAAGLAIGAALLSGSRKRAGQDVGPEPKQSDGAKIIQFRPRP